VDLFGSEKPFDFPKAPEAVMDSIRVCSPGEGGWVLDYFAGSGTTGQAIINLNREDDEGIRFILVEMGNYFETVLLPRIKKVTFSPEWKDGKPVRQATTEEAQRSPRIVKYLRLESYEDALNNISFTGAPQMLYDLDDYMLRYMLEWETKESATLLNIQQLASPFSYKLLVRSVPVRASGETVRSVPVRASGGTPHGVTTNEDKVVDLPETFAYLLGMHVAKRLCLVDKEASGAGRRYVMYRGRIDHRQVAVIWRDTAGWGKKDYERDKVFAAEQKLTEGADEVFVNGDSVIPGARSLDPVFKGRMFGS
jgi:adenine-specific DNA-methyltransferase